MSKLFTYSVFLFARIMRFVPRGGGCWLYVSLQCRDTTGVRGVFLRKADARIHYLSTTSNLQGRRLDFVPSYSSSFCYGWAEGLWSSLYRSTTETELQICLETMPQATVFATPVHRSLVMHHDSLLARKLINTYTCCTHCALSLNVRCAEYRCIFFQPVHVTAAMLLQVH